MNLPTRNMRIDFLRGIAILAVLVLHFHISYHLDQSILNKIFAVEFIKNLAGNGNYGVTMFFVISGFLITSTTLERFQKLGQVDLLGFYIFRFARIMPCLVLVLAIIVGLSYLHIPIFENKAGSPSLMLSIFSILTFWHNVLMEKAGYFNYCLNIYWSLSVEEVFYLSFPLLCVFFKKARFILPIWFAAIIIGPICRHLYSQDEIVALYGYFSCFDAIAMGCCAALLANKISLQNIPGRMLQWMASLTIIVVYLSAGIMDHIVWGISLVAFSMTILLIGASVPAKPYNCFQKIVCWFGKNSYELYLFHIVVLALMKEYIKPSMLGNVSKIVLMLVFLLISVTVSECIAKFYSQPMNIKLRKILNGLRQSKERLPFASTAG